MRPVRAMLTSLTVLATVAGLAASGIAAGNGTTVTRPGIRTSASTTPAATTSRHYIANLGGAIAPRRLGFNIFDTGYAKNTIDHLPRHVRALVWLGQKCPTRADATFRARVRRLAGDRRVYGYYLSDEPHVRDCPGGPDALATRAKFIRRVSSGRQKSFVVISQTTADWKAGYRDVTAFRPAVSRVDLVGIDAYPCSVNGCDFTKIPYKVRLARRGGIPLAAIVPVYQAFGQERATSEQYYTLPTARQERRILRAYAGAVPHPQMDYAYGWRHQDSANPTLVNSVALQRVFRRWFRG